MLCTVANLDSFQFYQIKDSDMDSTGAFQLPTSNCHVVAVPYPGRGHINSMINLCKLLASRQKSNILITFVVTEEWHGFISSDHIPDNIRFSTVPNVIPSELVRAKDFPGFLEAVYTKLEDPVEQLLDSLEPPVSLIVADPFVPWAVRIGNLRHIPVASLWPMSASALSMSLHFEMPKQKSHLPSNVSEHVDDQVISDIGLRISQGDDVKLLRAVTEAVSSIFKAQYLLSASVHELDCQVFDNIKAKFPLPPVYPIGPSIPYFELSKSVTSTKDHNGLRYLHWLDSQPKQSVLYISMGSFLSVSKTQMDEILAGVINSGVRYLLVARGDTDRLKDGGVGGEDSTGLVVPWCDQLRVLSHDSVGGFWSHCGWNSTMEAAYAGVPILACPMVADQISNGKKIVEDWKTGCSVRMKMEAEDLVSREEIAELVKRFMDVENQEGKEMRERAKQLQQTCQGAVAIGGSSDTNLDAFIKDILSQGKSH